MNNCNCLEQLKKNLEKIAMEQSWLGNMQVVDTLMAVVNAIPDQPKEECWDCGGDGYVLEWEKQKKIKNGVSIPTKPCTTCQQPSDTEDCECVYDGPVNQCVKCEKPQPGTYAPSQPSDKEECEKCATTICDECMDNFGDEVIKKNQSSVFGEDIIQPSEPKEEPTCNIPITFGPRDAICKNKRPCVLHDRKTGDYKLEEIREMVDYQGPIFFEVSSVRFLLDHIDSQVSTINLLKDALELIADKKECKRFMDYMGMRSASEVAKRALKSLDT